MSVCDCGEPNCPLWPDHKYPDQEQHPLEMEPTAFVVSVYLCDRAYGGPEEGGWWYDCGEPSPEHLKHLRVFSNRAEARLHCHGMQEMLDREDNVGRSPISSVLSTGQYRALIDEDKLPEAYPAIRPHYE